MRGSTPALVAERVRRCAGTPCRRFPAAPPPFIQVAFGLATYLSRALVPFRRWQVDSRSASFRQSDSDGLLWGTRAVFSLAHMFDLFANKLSCLCRGRLALLRIATRTLNYIVFWHRYSFSKGRKRLSGQSELSSQSRREATEPKAFLLVLKTFVTRSSFLIQNILKLIHPTA